MPANKLDLLLEAERRGILPEDKKALLTEARKRGIVKPAPVTAPLNVPTEDGGERVIQGAEREGYIRDAQADQAEQNKAEAKWKEGRGVAERAADTAAFVPSAIVRTATRGEYGLGDAVGTVSKRAGESVANAERDFVRANRGPLEKAAEYGEYAMGVPGLSTMGAPAGGIRAALTAARNIPRTPRAPRNPPPNTPQAPQNIQSLPDRLRDMQAFRELDMEPFAPAMASKGTARLTRTVEEIPLVGGTVKSPKTNVELQARDVQTRIARDLGADGTEEGTGQAIQRGLERFRERGIEDIEPGVLRGTPVGPNGPQRPMGINPYQPQPAAEAMSQAAARRATEAAPIRQQMGGGVAQGVTPTGGMAQTIRGTNVPAARPLNQMGLRRSNASDLSPDELTRLARAPSQSTSFGVRQEALYELAFRKIPARFRSDGRRNSERLAAVNTRQALGQVNQEIANQIAGQGTLRGGLAERMMNPQAHFSFEDLRAIRTEVGRTLGNFGQFDVALDRSQLRGLYSALSRDIETGLRDIANRAYLQSRLAPDAPDHVPISAARAADRALYEFRRADRYTRLGMAHMERFMDVLQAKTPSEAARKIVRMLSEKTANPQAIREIRNVLRPDEWNAVRGHIFEALGRGRAGAQEAETVFNFNHWATDFHKLTNNPLAREVLLGDLPPDVARRLTNLSRVVDRMKYYESTKNFSGSAYAGGGMMLLMSPSAMASATALVGGAAIAGKLLTSRPYTAFLENFMRAQMRVGNTASANARLTAQYARRLVAIGGKQRDPELGRAMQALGIAAQRELEGQERGALPAPRVAP